MAAPPRPHTPAPCSGVARQTRITMFSGLETSIDDTPETVSPAVLRQGRVEHVPDAVQAPGFGESGNPLLGAVLFLSRGQVEGIEAPVGRDGVYGVLGDIDSRRGVETFGAQPHAGNLVDHVGLELFLPEYLAVCRVDGVENVSRAGDIDQIFARAPLSASAHVGYDDGARSARPGTSARSRPSSST